MNLIDKYNISSCSEDHMQRSVAKLMALREFRHQVGRWHIDHIKPKVYMEISIPVIRRRSDIIVKLSDRKVFNIECKLNNVDEVIRQSTDHKKWADYSYICLHALTYIPSYQIHKMIKSGIGLMLWQDENERANRKEHLVDVFGAYKSGVIDKKIRKRVFEKLKYQDVVMTAGEHSQQKLYL